ncbi:MAG: hypothetical protein LBQ08_02070 [Holosporaceae bacterium]|nr:hypothetical protein [Holosporaceae bacterium]
MKKIVGAGLLGSFLCIPYVEGMENSSLNALKKRIGAQVQIGEALAKQVELSNWSNGLTTIGLNEAFQSYLQKLIEFPLPLKGKGAVPVINYKKVLATKMLDIAKDSWESCSDEAAKKDLIEKATVVCYYSGNLFNLYDKNSLFVKYVFPFLKQSYKRKAPFTINGIDRRIIKCWKGTCSFLNQNAAFADAKIEIWEHMYYNGLVDVKEPK